jgi:hypothetical protein
MWSVRFSAEINSKTLFLYSPKHVHTGLRLGTHRVGFIYHLEVETFQKNKGIPKLLCHMKCPIGMGLELQVLKKSNVHFFILDQNSCEFCLDMKENTTSVLHKSLLWWCLNKTDSVLVNVTLRRIHATIVALEKWICITYSEYACICSPRYPAYNAHPPFCHLWPAWLHSIFLHITNGKIFK